MIKKIIVFETQDRIQQNNISIDLGSKDTEKHKKSQITQDFTSVTLTPLSSAVLISLMAQS